MSAVAAPGRPDEDVERDEDRKPAEVLSFFGIKPGMVVADLMAGRGYYTEILSRLVGPTGHVYAHNNPFVDQRFAKQPLADRLARMGSSNVEITVQELDQLSFPRPLDAAMMVLFYHDTYWQKVDRKAMNKAIFDALRPGGTFGVIDHLAPVGTGSSVVETLHRIEKEMVLAEILAAGFVLEAESDILRHPDDDRSKNVFDESLRGKTDRFVLRFRKPEAP